MLRSPALYMGNPAVNHTAQNDRLSKAGLLRAESGQTASNRPLTATSGVLQGPAGTMGEVTLLSNTQFTVNPARWYIESSDTPLGGVYEVTNDAVETRTITAQDASLYRRSYWGVWVIDSFVAGSGDDLPHWGLIDGPLVASNPQLPAASALPENFLALGEFAIPPTGQSVTYTPYITVTGPRGGILPVPAADTRPGSADGVYRDHPTYGLQRWSASGGLWRNAFAVSDWQTFALAAGVAGDVANEPPQYRLEGTRVFLRGWVHFTAAAATNYAMLSAPLASIYRPTTSTSLMGLWEAAPYVSRLAIGSDGQLRPGAAIASGQYANLSHLSWSTT